MTAGEMPWLQSVVDQAIVLDLWQGNMTKPDLFPFLPIAFVPSDFQAFGQGQSGMARETGRAGPVGPGGARVREDVPGGPRAAKPPC